MLKSVKASRRGSRLTKSKGIEKCVPSEGSSSLYIDSFFPRSPWLNFKDSHSNFVEGVDDPPNPSRMLGVFIGVVKQLSDLPRMKIICGASYRGTNVFWSKNKIGYWAKPSGFSLARWR